MELRTEHIQKMYGIKTVLDDITFSLSQGQKVGLVGNNGSGKSTLLKILAGEIEADAGEVTRRQGLVVGYLPQDTSLVSDESVRQYVHRISGMQSLEQRASQSSDAMAEFEHRQGYSFEHRMQYTLAGLGLDQAAADRPIYTLSSGQKSKVFMAGVLLSDPDVLLLDEPTNNLDLLALIWLETFLERSRMACIIVSHDRLFLDRLVRKIMMIDFHTRKLTVTNGRYSDYLRQSEKERTRQLAAYEVQQEEIQRLTESARAKKAEAAQGAQYKGRDNDKFLRGFKRDRSARSGKVAKAIEKRIDQMERIEKPIEREAFQIRLQASKPDGSREITLKGLFAGYPREQFRIGPINIHIPYGSRVVILGLNGSGKSTLLKTISGDLRPLDGDVSVGGGLTFGNLMQEHDNLPRESSLKEFLTKRAGVSVQDAFALAARHGFSAEELEKKVVALSPGGRARLLFAAFTALSVNVLVLDEPTNHLDLEALEALEEMVSRYEGTIILVSHDRYFLERFKASDFYVLSNGHLVRQPDFASYVLQAEQEAKRLVVRL
ncbi:MAG: ABC-F family ATP-binding cassette domain-containing protein [Candidatus Kerfeldbacteria bacterium]|nr:ABC-F family ATP-binding cassette domain-containing protein [Candidatus Kerfeldbacteria bacterium]